jgi:hypothetical protein
MMRISLGSLAVLCALGFAAADAAGETIRSIASGASHTCAVTTSGGVLCWGDNSSGQLGDGTTTPRLTPTPVSGLSSGVATVAAAYQRTCAVTTSGALLCWGDTVPTPTSVSGLASGVTAVAIGQYHACALTASGAVLCWGNNSYGQLGNGTPVIAGGATAIAAGAVHSCALMASGGLLCWGDNEYGQIGDGTTAYTRPTPTAVSGLSSGVTAITAGYYYTCAITSGGAAFCWGDNIFGQLGDGSGAPYRVTPRAVSELAGGVTAITAGDYTTCALKTSGAALCWGYNVYGEVGDGTTTRRPTPTAVAGLSGGVAAIASAHVDLWNSRGHGCALTTSGDALCWGYNASGQLGDGTTISALMPTPISGLGAAPVAASDFGGDFKSDILWRHATLGEVWLWPMDGAAGTAQTYVRTVSDTDWGIRGLADFTGDGKADILWRHQTTGQIYLWPMNGSAPQAETFVATVDPAYDIVGTGDFDGDGKADILWRHTTLGEVWVWRMDGATPLSQVYLGTVDPGYVVKGVGDVDGDRKADIVWHHATAGEVWVWRMDGTTRLSESWVGTVADVAYQIVGLADFTGDGKADILWRHATAGDVWLWPMDGTTKQVETFVGTVPDTNYRIVNTGDYDGDGRADILWHHATLGEVWVWLMNGAARLSQTQVGAVPDVGYAVVKR